LHLSARHTPVLCQNG